MADQQYLFTLAAFRRTRPEPRFVLFALLILFAMSIAVPAQGVIEDDIAPPPLRLLSPSEKDRLAAEADVKRRTKLGLELMDMRLKQAETLDAADNFDEMFVQLGGFHGLMDNMLAFLNNSDKDSGKVLNNFKRFEIGLRFFTTRLELIRRDMPLRYEFYVRTLIKYLRATRAKAIEPMFDDSVVPQKRPVSSDL